MADRRVSASMTLEARQFRAEAKACDEDMKKLARSGAATDAALADLEHRAQKASTSLLKLAADGRLTAAELKKAEHQVDDLKGSLIELGATSTLTGLKGNMAGLDAQIVHTKARMKELGEEFRRTGSASSLAGFKDAQRDLRKLENLSKDLAGVLAATAAPAGKLFGNIFVTSAGDALAGSSGMVQVLGPLAIAAAPTIGATVGAGILLGIGSAGIAAGIAGQLHDPMVAAAGKKLGEDVSAGFKDATSSFSGPLVGALHEFDAEWDKLQPGLTSTFTQLAPLVTTLSRGAAGFVDKLVPGLERAAVASKPLVQDLSQWLPRLGSELAGLFSAIASHEAEAAQALHLLTDGIDLTIGSLTIMTHIGASAFDWGVPVQTKALADLLAKTDALTGSTGTLGKTLKQTSASSEALAAAIARVSQNYQDNITLAQGAQSASLALAADMAGLAGALDKTGLKLDLSSTAGVRNAQVLNQLAQDAERVRENTIAAGGGVDQANAAFRRQIIAAEKAAIAAGADAKAVHGLLDQYLRLAAAPDLNKYITVHIGAVGSGLSYVQTPHGKAAFAHGGVTAYAASGMASAPAGVYPAQRVGSFLFAEASTHGETLIPNYGIAAARGLALADYAASHYGGRVVDGQSVDWSRYAGSTGGGGGGGGGRPVELTVNLRAPDGRIMQQQLIRFALDTGRSTAQLWSSASR